MDIVYWVKYKYGNVHWANVNLAQCIKIKSILSFLFLKTKVIKLKIKSNYTLNFGLEIPFKIYISQSFYVNLASCRYSLNNNY